MRLTGTRREWARSIGLLLLLPVFFVLLGIGIRACGAGQCACPAYPAVTSPAVQVPQH